MNWEQLKTILWLRWRLMCNQWRRSGGLGAVFAAIVGRRRARAVGGGVSRAGCSAGFLVSAGRRQPSVMMVWFGVTAFFLFFWMIGLLTELQRSETIDLQKLMHLPVALGQMFAVNYLVSHFTVEHRRHRSGHARTGHRPGDCARAGNDFAGPAGVEHGLHDHGVDLLPARLAGDDDEQPAPPPHGHHVHHAVVRCCWRRGRIFISMFYQNRQRVRGHPPPAKNGSARQERARRLHEENVRQSGRGAKLHPAALGAGGRAGAGRRKSAAGAARHARLRRPSRRWDCGGRIAARCGFIMAKPAAKAAAKINPAAHPQKRFRAARPAPERAFLNCAIPFVPEQSAALALATLRSLLRAPEVKMAWATSFIVTIILGANVSSPRHGEHVPMPRNLLSPPAR